MGCLPYVLQPGKLASVGAGDEPTTQASALTGNQTTTPRVQEDAQPTEPHPPGLVTAF